jgi:hypothetical protein
LAFVTKGTYSITGRKIPNSQEKAFPNPPYEGMLHFHSFYKRIKYKN